MAHWIIEPGFWSNAPVRTALVVGLLVAKHLIPSMGLSGKVEPLLVRSVTEEGIYVCFAKSRVSPSFVQAFSRALGRFEKTETFQAIRRKYDL